MAGSLPIPAQRPDSIDQLIRAAIADKVVLQAVYDGGSRLLCPHILGRNKEGKIRVLCLQIGGESASGLGHKAGLGDWRCLSLEKFNSVTPTTAEWQTAGSSLRRPKCIDQIELAVADQPEREPQ